ncbi:SDR family oxidoreductase [Dictyobacter kobayashii]|uniref:Short-chain dehydrogenase n=1 Tax=Dictyobacter kobayashii TaxID=2014872 RepID=A0A402AYA4_9CHLR|nr:SDR family oxidoreductase [Dictyobacter kobayashii]GCE24079.1 short-chain dehydrogenase [Dictyobacter kobayashii]
MWAYSFETGGICEYNKSACGYYRGSSGIGLATARLLAESGAAVTIAGRQQTRVDAALEQLHAWQLDIEGAVVDATSTEALRDFFWQVGSMDHLVLSLSGGEGQGEFRTLDLAALRRGFEAKFWPCLFAAQASLHTLRADGSLTFVTAASARTSIAGTAGLAAINGALNATIPTLALELKPLRVNAVSPGVIRTAWWDKMPAEARENYFAHMASHLPVQRVGQAEDVAQAIQFLITNSFMTGCIIDCDGGARIH